MFIVATNGTYEPYQPYPEEFQTRVSASQAAHSSGTATNRQSSLGDHSVLIAHQAYFRASERPPDRKPAMIAEDIMKTPIDVLPPTATLADAWSLLQNKGFRHIPIVAPNGLLAGIVSDRDLLRYANILERHETARIPQAVQEIMTHPVLTATTTTRIREIAEVMLCEKISAMPIIAPNNCPIGILTVTDILEAIVVRAPLELWS